MVSKKQSVNNSLSKRQHIKNTNTPNKPIATSLRAKSGHKVK